jgi:N utilization substance protein B
MRKRTKSREYALQVLYAMDITREASDEALAGFWEEHADEELSEEVKAFCTDLVKGVEANLTQIDSKISQYAENWKLERMAVVDRNIMRLSCFELIVCNDIPVKVSINEAVELAKKYSGVEAGKFVNAILDKVKQEFEVTKPSLNNGHIG